MREPTVHALGSVLESKKATTQTMGEARNNSPTASPTRFFFRFVRGMRLPLENRASGGCHDDGAFLSVASLRSDSGRYRPERVIEIKSESVITFVGIRKQRKSRCEKRV
jgi:hypothetical protein